jgi:uncharacterized membrane protein YfcA
MVGLGGGFIAVPILLLFFGLPPAEASGTSLALVVANSGAGALTYFLQKRVHVRIGFAVAAGGFPGSIIGAVVSAHVSAKLFDWALAAFLIGVAIDMMLNRAKRLAGRHEEPSLITGMPWFRSLLLGFAVGFVSSLFGIGGGVLVVPSLLYFSDLPAHMISATSHFAIVLTSPVGLLTHWAQHDIRWTYAIPLVIGGLIGGPVGARLSLGLKQHRLMFFVAGALTVAAIALVARHFTRA